VGGSKEQEIDVRIVAATHRDLRARVAEGSFREDLLYRLDVVPIEMPALRQRPEDIPELLEHFLAAARSRYAGATVKRFSRDALARLLDYAWPGNVRELAHLTERVVLLSRGEEVSADDLPAAVRPSGAKARQPFSGEVIRMRDVQRAYAAWAYEQLGHNRTRTAEKLGIDFKTLVKYLQGAPDDSEG
jgi:two-component system response regulator HydG